VRQYNYVKLNFDELVRETEKAILLSFEGNEYWIPISLIDEDEFYEEEGIVYVADWFVEQEGLDPYIDEEDTWN